MPRYRVLQGFCLGAGVDVAVGAVIELPESEGRPRTHMGRLALESDEAPQESVKTAAPKWGSDKHKEK